VLVFQTKVAIVDSWGKIFSFDVAEVNEVKIDSNVVLIARVCGESGSQSASGSRGALGEPTSRNMSWTSVSNFGASMRTRSISPQRSFIFSGSRANGEGGRRRKEIKPYYKKLSSDSNMRHNPSSKISSSYGDSDDDGICKFGSVDNGHILEESHEGSRRHRLQKSHSTSDCPRRTPSGSNSTSDSPRRTPSGSNAGTPLRSPSRSSVPSRTNSGTTLVWRRPDSPLYAPDQRANIVKGGAVKDLKSPEDDSAASTDQELSAQPDPAQRNQALLVQADVKKITKFSSIAQLAQNRRDNDTSPSWLFASMRGNSAAAASNQIITRTRSKSPVRPRLSSGNYENENDVVLIFRDSVPALEAATTITSMMIKFRSQHKRTTVMTNLRTEMHPLATLFGLVDVAQTTGNIKVCSILSMMLWESLLEIEPAEMQSTLASLCFRHLLLSLCSCRNQSQTRRHAGSRTF
jgi:hypothetical protein